MTKKEAFGADDIFEEESDLGCYERRIQVRCPNCGWMDERDTEFVDIFEGFDGADVLTFKCPTCNSVHSSRRYG
jgi:hypothetical protein